MGWSCILLYAYSAYKLCMSGPFHITRGILDSAVKVHGDCVRQYHSTSHMALLAVQYSAI